MNTQRIKRRVYISLSTLGFYLFTISPSLGQVSICDNIESFHPVDIRALQLRDSLQKAGVDTIIVYRHWLVTNGFNGYGKVLWLNKGQCYQYKIKLENYDTQKIYHLEVKSDSLFNYFFDHQIDTITTNPTKQNVKMSHDSQHYVEVSYRNDRRCFLISGLLVQLNQHNLRAKFISLLSDEDVSFIKIDGERRNSGAPD
jgi:hypothetical protein